MDNYRQYPAYCQIKILQCYVYSLEIIITLVLEPLPYSFQVPNNVNISGHIFTLYRNPIMQVCLLLSSECETISRQALRLSTSARRETSVGEIVNLMSVDSQKFQEAPIFLHLLWSAPLTIGLCMYFLWQQLGPSVLAGLLVILLMIPVNGVIALKTRKLQVTTTLLFPNGPNYINII